MTVLLPEMPPIEASLFWRPIAGLGAGSTGSILVIPRGGSVRSFGNTQFELDPTFGDQYAEQQMALTGSAARDVSEKTLRRVGHFALTIGAEQFCSRYFHDASLCERELSTLLIQRLRALIESRQADPQVLLLWSSKSGWMENVAITAAAEFGLDVDAASATDRLTGLQGPRTMMLMDAVSSGRTWRDGVSQLADAGVSLARVAIAALGPGGDRGTPESGVRLEILHSVGVDRRRRDTCQQCALSLPFTDPAASDPHLTISSYAMWDIFLSVGWVADERDVPEGLKPLPPSPDLAAVFAEYGDWIAYKIDLQLKALGVGDEVVVVCPDEHGARELISRLRPRFYERLVAVFLPRPLLLNVASQGANSAVELAKEETPDLPGWITQLQHLGRSGMPIVLIDEFNASGGSARSMLDLTKLFGANVMAYMPVWNRQPSTVLPGVPVVPLYESESPRPL